MVCKRACTRAATLIEPKLSVICAHSQTYTMMVNYNDSNGRPDPTTGPTDDGYIAVAVKSTPQDPLCCMGLNTSVPGAGAQP